MTSNDPAESTSAAVSARLTESVGSMLAASTPDFSTLMSSARLTESIGSMLAASGLKDTLKLMSESFQTSHGSGLDESEIQAFARSLRDTADEEILAEADALYTRVLGPERPSTMSVDSLELTLPFEPDPYVRATLQLISVLSVWTVLFVVGSYAASIPILSGALYALGAPVPSVVWRASGKAVERLYGKGNYSPPRQSPAKGRKTGKGIW